LQGHAKEIFTLKWTPTGEASLNPDKPLLLCTASFDGSVKVSSIFLLVEYFSMLRLTQVWSALEGKIVFSLSQQQVQPVFSLSPSPNGLFFICRHYQQKKLLQYLK
jgi:transducin (beta)-like 1